MEQDPERMQQAFSNGTDHNSDASLCLNFARHGSFGRRGSRGSSRRSSTSLSRDMGDRILRSISLSRDLAEEMLGDVDSSVIAQVGDSGDRVMNDDRDDEKGSARFSVDDVRPVEDNFQSGPHFLNSWSAVLPVAEEVKSYLPADTILHSTEKDQIQKVQELSFKDHEYKIPRRLDYIFYLIHLALFGILGVLTRYLLQKLFGPSLLALTGDNSPLYLDLPSNMLGSFLMGWFGVVFKADIRHISEHLAVGLSTGYLGSVTTFSGWNQKMLVLASKGHWTFAVGGTILGMFIVNESIRVGVESGEGLRKLLSKKLNQSSVTARCSLDRWRVDSLKRHMMVMAIMLLLLGSLWGLSGALAGKKLHNVTNGAVLWLGCLVGPPGVWARWYLARLNGHGFGRKGLLKWLPIGTLSANILAACLMAALSTISKAVNTKRCTILVSGVQLGFLGCMSTVSTFVAEVYAMRESRHGGRALAYVVATVLPSFVMGTLIYSVPVWTKHYK